jgi:drug/metabolite transporter (DMT)-like permease
MSTSSLRKDHLDGLAVTILLACCLFWGFQQVLVKATIPDVPPVLQAFLRFAAGTVILLAWCAWRGIRLFARDGSLAAGLLAGALFAAEFACLFAGLQYTTASRLTVFVYTSPLWVAAIVPLMVRSERLRPVQWAGVVLAFVAIVFALRESFVASAAGRDAALMWRGDLLALIAGALWGLTTVVIRTTGLTKVSAEKLLFYQVAVSAVTLPFVSLGLGEAWSFNFSGFAWFSLVLQTVVGAFASYLAWMWLLGRYPATRVSVFVFLTPLFAILFGAWWLSEPISATLLIALAFVAVGIVLVNRRKS